MNEFSRADDSAAPGGAQPQPLALFCPPATLPPWQQLALLARRLQPGCPDRTLQPLRILRGKPSDLCRLRAAEMAAWESAQPLAPSIGLQPQKLN